MTSDTSGRPLPMPLAFYDPDTSSWRTSQATFDWASTPFSLTLPPWGTTLAGGLYALPTPVLHMDVSGCLSLLPTPETGVSPNGHGRRGGKPGNGRQSGASLDVVTALLPTPTANEATGPGHSPEKQGGKNLRTEVSLLPTPTANEWKGASQPVGRLRNGKERPLSDCRVSDLVTRGLIGELMSPLSDDGSLSSDEKPLTPPSPVTG